MMWCHTVIALIALYAIACNASAIHHARKMDSADVPLIKSETVGQSQVLKVKSNVTRQTAKENQIKSRTVTEDITENSIVKEENKSSRPEEAEESDYATILDGASDAEDEYSNNDGDGTSVSFLKQRKIERRAKVPPMDTTANMPGSAIYVTVPIYINTAGGMPLTLSVGGQNVPLEGDKSEVTKKVLPKVTEAPSKTSQYNKLPQYKEASEQSHGERLTNRQRSRVNSRNQARKEIDNLEKSAKVGSYSFYF